MIYGTPTLPEDQQARLSELDELRRQLGRETAYPTPWIGALRRQVRAASVESSVSIEGFELAAGQVENVVAGAASGLEGGDENRLAVASYARAMDHVGVMALDPTFEWARTAMPSTSTSTRATSNGIRALGIGARGRSE